MRENVELPCRTSYAGNVRSSVTATSTRPPRPCWHLGLKDLDLLERRRFVQPCRPGNSVRTLPRTDRPTRTARKRSPTAHLGLDYDAREAFIQLLFAECREAGSSLLFVSHDQSLAPLFDRNLSLAELNHRAATPAEFEMYLFRLAAREAPWPTTVAPRSSPPSPSSPLSVCLLLAVERASGAPAVPSAPSAAPRPDRRRALQFGQPAAVFGVPHPVARNNIRWDSYEHFAANPR